MNNKRMDTFFIISSLILINFREIFIYGNPLHWDLFFYDYAYTIFVILVGYLFFKKFSPLAAQSK